MRSSAGRNGQAPLPDNGIIHRAPTKQCHDPTNDWMFVRKDSLVSAMAASYRPTQEDTMAKLTDTQLMILAAAASRDDGSILPLPKTSKLDRETVDGVVNDLLKRKLVAERPAVGEAAIWREGDAGQSVTLIITPAGLRAFGLDFRQGQTVPDRQRRSIAAK